MEDSILDTIKKLLGIAPDYTAFDLDIITHINSTLMDVDQFGIGPTTGFVVIDKTQTWADLLNGATNLNGVRSYVALKVRLLFDPPQTSPLLSSMEKLADQAAWRLMIQADPPVEETTV